MSLGTTPSELCQRCGLCCDGTLFPRIDLSPSDARRLTAHGFELIRRPRGGWAIPLACQALEASRCTAYDLRPGSCRAYQCALLGALAGGKVSFEQALGVVGEAKRLRSRALDEQLEQYLRAHFHDDEL
jgi:uncharacterized protein